MKRAVSIVVFSTCAGLLLAADFQKTSLITIPQTIEVKASPAAVWTALTTWDGFGTLTGFKPTGTQKSFSKVGDSTAAQVWDDKGTLVVTAFVPQRELRVAWEPENASYLCAKRIVLKPSATGTTVEYRDRYTDDQPNAEETARKVVADTAQHVAAFRKMVEK
jgi:uncharacterized protein YndB with AHSA1/START domain